MNSDIIPHIFIQWLAHNDVLDQWLSGLLKVCSGGPSDTEDTRRVADLRDDMAHAMIHITWSGLDTNKWENLNDEWYEIHNRLTNEY